MGKCLKIIFCPEDKKKLPFGSLLLYVSEKFILCLVYYFLYVRYGTVKLFRYLFKSASVKQTAFQHIARYLVEYPLIYKPRPFVTVKIKKLGQLHLFRTLTPRDLPLFLRRALVL